MEARVPFSIEAALFREHGWQDTRFWLCVSTAGTAFGGGRVEARSSAPQSLPLPSRSPPQVRARCCPIESANDESNRALVTMRGALDPPRPLARNEMDRRRTRRRIHRSPRRLLQWPIDALKWRRRPECPPSCGTIRSSPPWTFRTCHRANAIEARPAMGRIRPTPGCAFAFGGEPDVSGAASVTVTSPRARGRTLPSTSAGPPIAVARRSTNHLPERVALDQVVHG